MPLYLVKSPGSGKWICAPLDGASASIEDAFPYRHDDPYLEYLVKSSLHLGKRLILRQLPESAVLEVVCPECRGIGRANKAPCDRCTGRGIATITASQPPYSRTRYAK